MDYHKMNIFLKNIIILLFLLLQPFRAVQSNDLTPSLYKDRDRQQLGHFSHKTSSTDYNRLLTTIKTTTTAAAINSIQTTTQTTIGHHALATHDDNDDDDDDEYDWFHHFDNTEEKMINKVDETTDEEYYDDEVDPMGAFYNLNFKTDGGGGGGGGGSISDGVGLTNSNSDNDVQKPKFLRQPQDRYIFDTEPSVELHCKAAHSLQLTFKCSNHGDSTSRNNNGFSGSGSSGVGTHHQTPPTSNEAHVDPHTGVHIQESTANITKEFLLHLNQLTTSSNGGNSGGSSTANSGRNNNGDGNINFNITTSSSSRSSTTTTTNNNNNTSTSSNSKSIIISNSNTNKNQERQFIICECHAWSPRGITKSQPAIVEIAYIDNKFSLATHMIHLAENSRGKILCTSPRGLPKPIVHWQKNGAKISENYSNSSSVVVTATGMLIIAKASINDIGNYSCVAENIAGKRISQPVAITVTVNGGWTDWTQWTKCTCKNGYMGNLGMSKNRTCTNPTPMYGGAQCFGPTIIKTRECALPCPVIGRYSEWSEYTECSEKCIQTRRRRCKPYPKLSNISNFDSGDDISAIDIEYETTTEIGTRILCPGRDSETVSCMTGNCAIKGNVWPLYVGLSIAAFACLALGAILAKVLRKNYRLPAYSIAPSDEVQLTADKTVHQPHSNEMIVRFSAVSDWSNHKYCSVV